MLPAVLVLFVPMIMGTGGNSGGQSSVTVTRSISLGEVEFPDIFRVFWKELRIGIMCALTLGVVTFFKVWLIDGLLLANDAVTLTVSLTVALSLALTIIVAKIIGATLPLLAKRIGLDPAVMASPLITTLVDAISLGWLAEWRRRAWRLKSGGAVKNPDLWMRLDELLSYHDVTLEWIKGHAGHPYNERCDALATAAADSFRDAQDKPPSHEQ